VKKNFAAHLELMWVNLSEMPLLWHP